MCYLCSNPAPWDGMDLRVCAPKLAARLRGQFQDCKARCCCRMEELQWWWCGAIDLYRRQQDGSGIFTAVIEFGGSAVVDSARGRGDAHGLETASWPCKT
jgi:hypothetical protein